MTTRRVLALTVLAVAAFLLADSSAAARQEGGSNLVEYYKILRKGQSKWSEAKTKEAADKVAEAIKKRYKTNDVTVTGPFVRAEGDAPTKPRAGQAGPVTYYEVYAKSASLTNNRWRRQGTVATDADVQRLSASLREQDPNVQIEIRGPLYGYADDDPNNPFRVDRGQVTFDAEGREGTFAFHSRIPHVPSDSSGLTIGRGYDMKFRSRDDIIRDLTEVGLTREQAEAYAGAAGLSGDAAREYMRANKDRLVQITPEQQKALFDKVYVRYRDGAPGQSGARQIVGGDRWSVTGRDGKKKSVNWDTLNPAIQEILVDMNYRGDLNRQATAEHLREALVNNDLNAFVTAMRDRTFWFPGGSGRWSLDDNRFNQRVRFLERAAQAAQPRN